MRRDRTPIACACVALITLTASLNGQSPSPNVLLDSSAIPWRDAGNGVRIATLFGDPQEAKEPFAFRLIVPGGFTMGPHTHPVAEHMTVISGRFFVGIGSTLDRTAARAYGPGSYIVIAADVPAYMWAEGETVVQVHGVGPLTTTAVEEE